VERRLPLEVEAVLFGKSENTKRTVAKRVSRFLRWVGKPLREVSREDVDRYLLTELAGRKRSAQLLLLYLAKVFDYIGKRDLAEHCRERKRGVKIYEEEQRRGALTGEELAKVTRTIDLWIANWFDRKRRMGILFKLIMLTGIRLSEALTLTKEDVGDGVIAVRGKGGKVQVKPVPDAQLLELVRKLGPRPFPFTDRTAELWFKRLLREAGLPEQRVKELKVHDLRRTFALILYEETRDIELVREFLGHSSSKVTEIYLGRGMKEIQAKRRAQAAQLVSRKLQSLSSSSASSSASQPSSGKA
jgi:integrase